MSLFSSILTLFLVQDPIGNIPVCFSLLKHVSKKRRVFLIVRENLIALAISSIFLVSGKNLLNYLHITTESLGLAGGFILFSVAFNMIFPKSAHTTADNTQHEPFIVPLAIPLLAGPSTIATITLYASQYPDQLGLCFLALCIVTLLSTLILLLAIPLQDAISPSLLQALERLMGVILITMATQMILDNLNTYIKWVMG